MLDYIMLGWLFDKGVQEDCCIPLTGCACYNTFVHNVVCQCQDADTSLHAWYGLPHGFISNHATQHDGK